MTVIASIATELDLAAAAVFSPCRRYRYLLRRDIDMFGGRVLVSIGYNPSMADAERNDPTIRREIDFCKRWAVSTFIKVNVFAAISDKPAELAGLEDPVGPLNDSAITLALRHCSEHGGIALATWGVPKGRAVTKRIAEQRFACIRQMGVPLQALRVTGSGYPEHPLYVPARTMPSPWAPLERRDISPTLAGGDAR